MTLSSDAKPFFASALAEDDADAALVSSVNGILEEILAVKGSWPGQTVRMDDGARSNLSAAESAMLANESRGRVISLLLSALGHEISSLRRRFASSRPVTEFDIPGLEGFIRKIGFGAYVLQKTNLSSIADPRVTDDVTKGYSLGSPWINTADDGVFLCASPTQGRASWINLSKRVHTSFCFLALDAPVAF